jgi:hypothetical protein
MSDFDSPWKEALERWFPEFLAFFFPAIHAAIDWSRGHEMLDTELQQVVRDAEMGRRHVDKLIKVWRGDGAEVWVLIHVEVQSQHDDDFPQRMYVYNYRLFDRYNRVVVSLAVLADENGEWRPSRFRASLWGCTAGLEFPVVKLLDWADSESNLEANPNPFAVVVLTHLHTLRTRGQPTDRLARKIGLVRGLYECGLEREDVLELFRVIDWMMELPEDLAARFDGEAAAIEKEKEMPYVTHIERRALEKGREEGFRNGLVKGMELTLEVKFGVRGKRLMTRVRAINDVATLETLHQALKTAKDLAEFRKLLP